MCQCRKCCVLCKQGRILGLAPCWRITNRLMSMRITTRVISARARAHSDRERRRRCVWAGSLSHEVGAKCSDREMSVASSRHLPGAILCKLLK